MLRTPEEEKQFNEAMEVCILEENKQFEKDALLLIKIKNCVSSTLFREIEFQLEESENPSNLRIIDTPIGKSQIEGDYIIWIDQCCGYGDNYSGTMCMKLPNNKYLMWDYYM